MRIILTGPTGVVGTALIRQCIKNRIEVLAICRRNCARSHRIPQSALVKLLELDLEEYARYVPEGSEGSYDVFYHFAWEGTAKAARNDVRMQERNIRYALDAVRLADRFGCHIFIGAGSQAEYGRVEGKLSARTETAPENGYGMAKLCAGQMTGLLCRSLGMKHIWARILSVYGPCDGEDTMLISSIRKLLRGETPQFTKAEQQWDFLYCDDAARALLLLGEKGKNGKIYCIGSGGTRALADYIKCMRDAVSADLDIGIGALPYASKQVMYLCADISELKEDTGFSPRVPFEEGIKRTVAWCRENR